MPLNSTIPQAHEMYFAAMGAMGRSPKTIYLYRYTLTQLVTHRGDPDLLTLTRFEALSYTKHLNDNYAPGGVNCRLKAIKAFYGWCIAEELATANPFTRITVNVPDDPRPTADEVQIARMLASAKARSKRDHALLTLLVDTGCRKGEIAALVVNNIDLISGTVTFPISKSRPRTVPLTDRAVVALGRWLRQRGTAPGSLWSVLDPYTLTREVVYRHSNRQLSPHQLRRAFAVRWLSKGGTESGLMRTCGWSSSEMVRLYSRAFADVLAADEFKRLMA